MAPFPCRLFQVTSLLRVKIIEQPVYIHCPHFLTTHCLLNLYLTISV